MDQNLVEDLAFSPNGALLVTAGTENMGGLAKVWELDTGKLRHNFTRQSGLSFDCKVSRR